jgi:hypothetical protein
MMRGVECAPCRRVGHRCPAVVDDGEAMCLDCLNERPCAALRCVGKVREESGVRLQAGDFGLVEFCNDVSEVIQRTPEELGLERVVVAQVSAPSWLGRDARPAKRVERTEAQVEKLRAALGKVPLRVIGGEPVVMPADASMGAEPLEGFIAERRKQEESEMPRNYGRISEEIRKQILSEPVTESNSAVGRKYGVKEGTVWYLRNQAGIRSAAKPGFRKGAREHAMVPASPRPASVQQAIVVEPGRPGTASSLIDALAKIDGSEDKVSIELTMAEIGKILGNLGSANRAAFVSAGLRAALLA